LSITLKEKIPDVTNIQKVQPSRVTDLSYLDKFCEGDKNRVKKYISMFTSTAPGLIEKINTALVINDLDEIANQVHGFKTKWIMMGMAETKDLAIRLEHLCREGSEVETIREIIVILIINIEMAITELSK
jgi:HPt (histidine-containing phosphotransfer) domain-containing protein